jgi:hypothetical protein
VPTPMISERGYCPTPRVRVRAREESLGGGSGVPFLARTCARVGIGCPLRCRAIEPQGRSPEREREGGPASATYGSSAISRARLIATAICR